MDASHFDRIHLYTTFQKDEPEILYHGLPKCELLSLEVELMSAEDVQDLYHNGMVFLLCLATENEDVVHVDDYNSFINEFSEDVVHHHLERPGLLVRPKNMTRGSTRPWFVQKAAFHSSLSLILTLLYPHRTSSLVKCFTLASDTILRMSGIRGRGRHS